LSESEDADRPEESVSKVRPLALEEKSASFEKGDFRSYETISEDLSLQVVNKRSHGYLTAQASPL
jgi:hypothetical protein